MATFSERVLLARTKRGLSQKVLSAQAGLSDSYVAQIEHQGGDRSPLLDNAEKLARALNVPIAWLAFGSGPEPDWSSAAQGAARS